MFLRCVLYLHLYFVCFGVGLVSVQMTGVDGQENQNEHLVVADSPNVSVLHSHAADEFPNDNCGSSSTDNVPMEPIVGKWLRNEKISDVAYCSEIAIEATGGFDPMNVLPEFVDLNNDGIDELAVRYMCSPTSNCAMKIFQRTDGSYRQIFADRQMVSYFEKLSGKHAGMLDLQTRSHGSCCDGDQVTYRFNGMNYQPISCAEYSYWDQESLGETTKKPLITKRSCRKALDPL